MAEITRHGLIIEYWHYLIMAAAGIGKGTDEYVTLHVSFGIKEQISG